LPETHCACLRRNRSRKPDAGNLHVRFEEGSGALGLRSYSTSKSFWFSETQIENMAANWWAGGRSSLGPPYDSEPTRKVVKRAEGGRWPTILNDAVHEKKYFEQEVAESAENTKSIRSISDSPLCISLCVLGDLLFKFFRFAETRIETMTEWKPLRPPVQTAVSF
jgi:hypothetical protein